jgi:hypothetical protein
MQRGFAWTGPVMIVVFLVGFLVAGFVPPRSPGESAQVTAATFAEHSNRIQIGLIIAGFAAALIAPWSVAISLQIKRISARHSGFAYAELILGALLIVEFIVPLGFWAAAAYRPLEDPTITQRLNDAASIMLVGVVATAIVEAVILGLAFISDRGAQPLFPRWIAYANFAAALLFIPGAFCPLARTGPIAWNGFYTWWVALAAFGTWIFVLTYGTLRVIGLEQREPLAAG